MAYNAKIVGGRRATGDHDHSEPGEGGETISPEME